MIFNYKARKYRKLVTEIQSLLDSTEARRISYGYVETKLPYDQLTEKQKQRNCYCRGWKDGSNHVISEISCLFERWGINDKR